jgi:hypothetical protein
VRGASIEAGGAGTSTRHFRCDGRKARAASRVPATSRLKLQA